MDGDPNAQHAQPLEQYTLAMQCWTTYLLEQVLAQIRDAGGGDISYKDIQAWIANATAKSETSSTSNEHLYLGDQLDG